MDQKPYALHVPKVERKSSKWDAYNTYKLKGRKMIRTLTPEMMFKMIKKQLYWC